MEVSLVETVKELGIPVRQRAVSIKYNELSFMELQLLR